MDQDDLELAEAVSASIRDVFSVVPDAERLESSRRIIRDYFDRDATVHGTIAWVDFEASGRFVRGGITDVSTRTTILVDRPEKHKAVEGIVAASRDQNLRAGMIHRSHREDLAYWYVPYTEGQADQTPTTHLRGVSLSAEVFSDVVKIFNPEAALTQSESWVLFQLISGQKLREASLADGVAFETKRTQFKSACFKLNQSGQADVIRLLIGQMVHILYLCSSEASRSAVTERFTSEHLGGVPTYSLQRLSSGRQIRVWEMGPRTGRPILLVHGYLFPFLMNAAQEYLEQHGIRLIIPIRSGYLDGTDSADLAHGGQLTAQTVIDLCDFVRETASGPLPILGHATGGLYSMLMIARAPELFGDVAVCSLNLLRAHQKTPSLTSRFLGGVRSLAAKTGIFESLTRQFQRTTFSSEDATRTALRQFFQSNQSDLDILNGTGGRTPAFAWYRYLHSHSLLGIPNDFSVMAAASPSLFEKANRAVTFVHGGDDPATDIDDIRKFASGVPLAKVVALDGAGQLASGSHAEELWAIVAENLH